MESIPVFRYLGDTDKAMAMKPFGYDTLKNVRQFMSFQGLKIHTETKKFANGAEILASNVYGTETVWIYYPRIKLEIKKKEQEELEFRSDYVIITSKPKPWDPEGSGTYYTIDDWSIVWDIANDKMATNIPDGLGGFVVFPCDDSELDYWRDNKTEEKSSYASLSLTTFPNAAFTSPWTDVGNFGVEIFPTGYESTMCQGQVYNYTKIGDYVYRTMFADKYKWESEMPLGTYICCRRKQYLSYHDAIDRSDGKINTGTIWYDHHMMVDENPLGTFEDFVVNPNYAFWMVYLGSSYIVYDVRYDTETYTADYPVLGYYAGYSENAHLQFYIHWNRINRSLYESGDPGVGWTHDETQLTKVQIHAGCKYLYRSNNAGAQAIDPFSLNRNTDLEAAFLDLIKTQLADEDGTIPGQNWSTWFLDIDHDPTWPAEADNTLYTTSCNETYMIQLLNGLSFSISFRRVIDTV